MTTLFGPFDDLLTMDNLPEKGPINDDQLERIQDGGILVDQGKILALGPYKDFQAQKKFRIKGIALPSFIDAHTHMCFAGTRTDDYQKKLQGKSYQDIAKAGGGILVSVQATREASSKQLLDALLARLKEKLRSGVATVEIKSGYGLNLEAELKMLKVIESAKTRQPLTIVPTLLAAHALPPEFENKKEYLQWIVDTFIKKLKWRGRVDIFCDSLAFSPLECKPFLMAAKKKLVVHADQFSKGGAALAASLGALSADHLEMSGPREFALLKKSGTIPIVLPGASLGCGLPFAKARQILDTGLPLVIASDWNPGSAPSGDLLLQASLLAIYEKLSMAETLAGITVRAARALELKDRGILRKGMRADFSVFPGSDYREILYWQGSLKPKHAVISGKPHVMTAY